MNVNVHKREMMTRTAQTIAEGGKGGKGVWAKLVREFCDAEEARSSKAASE
jgi:hypothetical protein